MPVRKRFVIRNNVIENVIQCDDDFAVDGADLLDAEVEGNIGWEVKDGAPVKPPEPPKPTNDEIDQAALNSLLSAQGSVMRALAEVLIERDTAMTQAVANATSLASLKADFPKPVTRKQFVAALKNKMRG